METLKKTILLTLMLGISTAGFAQKYSATSDYENGEFKTRIAVTSDSYIKTGLTVAANRALNTILSSKLFTLGATTIGALGLYSAYTFALANPGIAIPAGICLSGVAAVKTFRWLFGKKTTPRPATRRMEMRRVDDDDAGEPPLEIEVQNTQVAPDGGIRGRHRVRADRRIQL